MRRARFQRAAKRHLVARRRRQRRHCARAVEASPVAGADGAPEDAVEPPARAPGTEASAARTFAIAAFDEYVALVTASTRAVAATDTGSPFHAFQRPASSSISKNIGLSPFGIFGETRATAPLVISTSTGTGPPKPRTRGARPVESTTIRSAASGPAPGSVPGASAGAAAGAGAGEGARGETKWSFAHSSTTAVARRRLRKFAAFMARRGRVGSFRKV